MVRSNLVIAGSNFIFSHINENYGNFFSSNKRKLLVIFRGINTNYYNPQKILPIKMDKFAKQHNIDRNKFIILMPGRLTPWKGQKKLQLMKKQVFYFKAATQTPWQKQ